MEIELKLLLDTAAAAALHQHPLLASCAIALPRLLDTKSFYYDTPDLAFYRSGAGLRVRETGDGRTQTLKGGGGVETGMHSRHEWETRVDRTTPDIAALRAVVDRDTTWHRLLCSTELQDCLQPVFTTAIKRTVWDLRLANGDEIECVLDQGEIARGDRSLPVCELELELKTGDPASLFELALVLQQDIAMRVGSISKAEQGYELLSPVTRTATKAAPIQLSAEMTPAQAMRAIVGNCVAHAQANEAGVLQGDVESIHQMRVGWRRVRLALTLFRYVAPEPRDLRGELDWLSAELGAARDWDVLAQSTLPPLAGLSGSGTTVDAVLSAAHSRAHQLHERISAAVNSQRYTRLVLGLGHWLLSCGEQGSAFANCSPRMARLRKFTRSLLKDCERRLQKRGKKLDGGTDERHKVRVSARQCRYATEFFASLLSQRRVRPYLHALNNLQEDLGSLNDTAVAERLLDELDNTHPELAAGTGFVRGYLSAMAARDDKRIRKRWQAYRLRKSPW